MKYFLYDHAGCFNRGCEAILRGTENIIAHADQQASFLLASHHPDADTAIGMETVGISPRALTKSETLISALNIKIAGNEKYALKKMYSPVADAAQESEICLSVGGDTYCYGDNAPMRAVTELLHKRGKKTVLWGASIGKEDLTAEKIASLKQFDAVFAREPLTFEMLGSILPQEKLFQFADPAFCMAREDLPLPEGFEEGNTLGFNLSPLVVKKNPDLCGACVRFLDYIIDNTTLQIALIPHVTEPGNNDCDTLQTLFDAVKDKSRLVMIPGDLNAMQYKGYIARLRFFIGARTHATIAAYSNGVPTIVLGYSVKSRGIAKDLFSKEKFVLNVASLPNHELMIAEFRKLLEQEAEVRETLRQMIPVKLRSAMSAGGQLMKL